MSTSVPGAIAFPSVKSPLDQHPLISRGSLRARIAWFMERVAWVFGFSESDLRLKYNNPSASPKPALLFDVTLSSSEGLEGVIAGTLNVNGTDYATTYFNAASIEQGAFRIAQQPNLSALPTGRYDYTFTLESDLFAGNRSR